MTPVLAQREPYPVVIRIAQPHIPGSSLTVREARARTLANYAGRRELVSVIRCDDGWRVDVTDDAITVRRLAP